MDLLKGIIAQKKKDVQVLKEKTGSSVPWFTRRDAELLAQEEAAKAQAEAEAKQREKEAKQLYVLAEFLDEKKNKSLKKSSPSEQAETSMAKRHKIAHNNKEDDITSFQIEEGDLNGAIPIGNNEVIRRLRRRGEVVTYFGESDRQRYDRLCQSEIEKHDDELMGGQRNVFLQLLEEDENAVADEDYGKAVHPDQDDDDGSGGPVVKQKEEDQSKEGRVRAWIRKMLSHWEAELLARSEAAKITTQGKVFSAQYRQTKKDLRPLVKKLRQKRVDSDVLDKIFAMVEHCENREYRAAHDTYIQLSIGNAAWPMGVTMVGIHERAGRSKIFTSEIAHILNDETTRKYIHMFKRLISLAQRMFPADPSQMVSLSTTHV